MVSRQTTSGKSLPGAGAISPLILTIVNRKISLMAAIMEELVVPLRLRSEDHGLAGEDDE
jgi:hypothetical protein